MEIKIKDKEYTLHFGILFVRKLDELHNSSQNGITIGMGLPSVIPGLMSKDAATLAEVLYFAAFTNPKHPSQADIEQYLEDSSTDIDSMFDEVLKELGEANATKSFIKSFQGAIKK